MEHVITVGHTEPQESDSAGNSEPSPDMIGLGFQIAFSDGMETFADKDIVYMCLTSFLMVMDTIIVSSSLSYLS